MQHRSIATLIILLVLGGSPLAGAGAPFQATDEYQVKAAFLYNFARFVEWPPQAFADAGSPLRICVVGKQPFGRHLDALEGRLVQGRRVAVIDPGTSRALTQTCHVLFVSRAAGDLRTTVSSYAGFPILTVTEIDKDSGPRGIINLVKEWSDANGESSDRFRIVFEIDVGGAENAGLQLASRLLELALVRSNTR